MLVKLLGRHLHPSPGRHQLQPLWFRSSASRRHSTAEPGTALGGPCASCSSKDAPQRGTCCHQHLSTLPQPLVPVRSGRHRRPSGSGAWQRASGRVQPSGTAGGRRRNLALTRVVEAAPDPQAPPQPRHRSRLGWVTGRAREAESPGRFPSSSPSTSTVLCGEPRRSSKRRDRWGNPFQSSTPARHRLF